ncbi:hypothetical protein AXW83_10160 [Bosea sp. PAMC 26642]|nr:hypothetical protein AXW83_10160 [Bosea sp. PAMC 26642]
MIGLGALLAMSGLAGAQAPAPIRPDALPAISMDQARRIAADNGMMRVDDIKLDNGVWDVDGRDGTGAEMELKVRATDGTVIKVERERPASAAVRP